jgi:hypothetical protein
LSYDTYLKNIQAIVEVCKHKMQQDNLPDNDLAKNMVICQFMGDTLRLQNFRNQKEYVHYPLQYDFDDFWGSKDWRKQFVTKTIQTGTGQCHSLPLFYLILAEELGAEAYLALSPNHSYIKFKTKYGWQNYETTSHCFTTDADVMTSGYIKSEAITHQVYLDTLSKKDVIANCLLDLGQGYVHKYGVDGFYQQCFDLALKHTSNHVMAWMQAANYYATLLGYIRQQFEAQGYLPNIQQVPEALKIQQQLINADHHIKTLGYAEMPKEAYDKWLQDIEKEKAKRK